MISPIQLFQDGGALMWVNLVILAIVLAVAVERFVNLSKMRINEKAFLSEIELQVKAGNFDKAQVTCSKYAGSTVAGVVLAALKTAKDGRLAVAGAVEEAVSEAMPRITKRAGVLWGLANLATLVGLVGTVFGLIQSFAAIGMAAPDQKSQLLTEGIAHAMSNTAFGLAIATFCVMLHMVVSSFARSVMQSTEHAAVKIENVLNRHFAAASGRVEEAPRS